MASQQQLLDAVKLASETWKNAFNSGDATSCAGQYETDAVMHARPFGTFTGTDEIRGFWEKLIADGFSDVEYIDPNFEIVDDTSVLLTSGWRMNNAQGVIHRELWVLQADGKALLRDDDFEAK
ncbi:Uncharacterised protein [BD1-7 clade bacterium]|uniref:SnoaL-like domain-containing protein n=1 Tax=BD1-7 clade bacterium TaxID=2029982 RepID=A0A5S9P485_9GAMM|nr:Uncharacterised protein [BD1-7 clade bacterium]CAA0097952.1 Uncharacterised protein [BD1-7 clade bacterium]